MYALQNNEDKSAEETNRMNELEYEKNQIKELKEMNQTYGSLINRGAENYMIAFSQCESIYNVRQPSRVQAESTQIVKDYAKSVEEGSAAGVNEMLMMLEQNGQNAKIVDDPNYLLTEEEKEKGVELIYYSKSRVGKDGKDSEGHYQLIKDGKMTCPGCSNNYFYKQDTACNTLSPPEEL